MSELVNPAASRWDLDRLFRINGLGPPFTDGVSCADLDIEVERHAHFLDLEGKRTGQQLSIGQRRAMEARLWTNRTCIVFWGDPDAGTVTEVGVYREHFPGSGSCKLVRFAADLSVLHALLVAWWRWADSQPWPPRTRSGFDAGEAIESIVARRAA